MNRNFILISYLLVVGGCTERQKSSNDVGIKATIYFGGDIVTMEGPPDGTVESVVTIEDTIAFTGTQREAESRFPRATKFDLEGKVLVPGFIDNHLHPGLGAVLLPLHWITPEDWQLANNRKVKATLGKEDFLREVQRLVDAFKPEDQIVQIFGYSQFFHGDIYKKELDQISTEVPINLFHRSFHENIFNSAALDYYGYNEENMDDPYADFEKGLVLESFQMIDFLYGRWVPTLTSDKWREGLEEVTQLLLQNGITSVHGPGGFLGATPEQINATYQVFANASARSYFSYDVRLSFENGYNGTMDYIREIAQRNDEHIVFLTDQIKLFLDGGMFSQLMMLSEPYTDGHKGQYIMHPRLLYQLWKPFWENGIDAHIHVNGDQGVDDLIYIVKTLQDKHPREKHRTVIEHFGVSRPEQSSKMKEL